MWYRTTSVLTLCPCFYILYVILTFYIPSATAINCYQCTNLPNNTLYKEGCEFVNKNETIGQDLLQKCAQNRSTNALFYELLESVGYLHGNGSHNPQLTTMNGTQISPNDIILDFFCLKVSAEINKNPYILRGCIYAVSPDMKDRCEEFDNEYDFDGAKVKKGKVCFCNKDGCNGAQEVIGQPVTYLVTGLLTLFHLMY